MLSPRKAAHQPHHLCMRATNHPSVHEGRHGVRNSWVLHLLADTAPFKCFRKWDYITFSLFFEMKFSLFTEHFALLDWFNHRLKTIRNMFWETWSGIRPHPAGYVFCWHKFKLQGEPNESAKCCNSKNGTLWAKSPWAQGKLVLLYWGAKKINIIIAWFWSAFNSAQWSLLERHLELSCLTVACFWTLVFGL